MELNLKIANAAAIEMFRTVGDISDLPPRLRNTFANLFYKKHFLIRHLDRSTIPNASIKEFYKERAEMLALHKNPQYFVEMAKLWRNIVIDEKPNTMMIEYWETVLLDLLKYNIPNALHKPGFWRAIERRRRKVTEIDGLYDIMAQILNG